MLPVNMMGYRRLRMTHELGGLNTQPSSKLMFAWRDCACHGFSACRELFLMPVLCMPLH